jgi:hypothetical protein
MPPENLVDYAASPEEPSLDAMRYALTQRNATPNQQQRPLDGITDTFKRLAAEFNPLMMGRTLQDAPKVMYNAVAAPVAGTWAGALRNVQAAGAAQAYGALGMPQEAAAAQSRVQPVKPQDAQLQLRSNAGQQTQQALGEAFNALQLPPVGPGSGMPGTAPLSPRPMLTPNDVRVMGARAAHTIREAGQIPTDVANVRNAGIQRMSPLTGEPSVGSRLGSAIEGTSQAAGRVGDVARGVGQSTADYMQMRRDMGLSPVPGVPPEFFPDMRMYAMRPKDSTLVTPSVPPTKDVTALDIGTAPQTAIHDIGAHRPELRTSDALAYLAGMDLDVPRNDAQGTAPITSERQAAFNTFIEAQAKALYPDAPNAREAVLAFDEQFSRQVDKDAARVKLYDQFRDSPEGQAVDMGDLPSSMELQERHTAASQWLNSTLLNYAKRKFGAEGDPLVQQASQGFTMLPADDVRRMSESVNEDVLKRRRAQAGMPVAGTLAPAIRDKSVELADATAAVEQLQQRREEYRNVAMQQGLPDPAQLPEYAATTNPLSAAVAKRDKLQDELSNLQLGRDYEKLSDITVTVDTQPSLLGKIDYPQQQFYPSVTRARPDETLFHVSRNSALQSTGFNELATQFYDDVIRGNIPIDKLKGLTVEKYVRGKAEGRVLEEKRQAQATAALKTNIESRMQEDMAHYVKPENYFGNVGVLELSTSTGFHIDEIRRLISDDTLVLDHCVAEGPTPGSKAKNLWNGRERRYMPLVDPTTGQLLPNSSRTYTRYIRDAGNPDANQADMLASVRDRNTGLPVATIEFKHLPGGKYSIGYASGYQNGVVEKAYHDAIKQYLNSRANVIQDANSDLNGVGLIDLHSTNAVTEAMSILGVPRREAAAALNQALDSGQLPRFGSSSDLRQALESPPPAAQQPAAAQPFTTNDLTAWINDWRGTRIAAGVTRALFDARRDIPTNDPGFAGVLRDHPTEFATRLVAEANRIGDGELSDALRDLAARITRSNAPQQPAAQQPDTQQGITAADLYNSLRDVAQAYGRDEGDAMLHVVRQVRQTFDGAPSYEELLREQPTAFAERIVDLAQEQGNAIVEQELLALADRIAPPVPSRVQLNPLGAWPLAQEMPAAQQPAPQRIANFDVHGMARDLLENARRDNQTFDIGDLGSSLFTLTHGNFDDFRFRALGADSAVAQRQVADALRQLIQDAGIQMPGLGVNQQPANAAAEFDRVPFDDAMMNFDQALTELAIEEGTYAPSIAEIDRVLDDLQHGANAIYGLYEGNEPLTDREREYLIRQLQALRQTFEEAAVPLDFEPDLGHPANQPAAAAVEPPADNLNIAPFRRIPADVRAMDSATLADQGMTHGQYQDVLLEARRLTTYNNIAELQDIIQLVRSHAIGGWELFSPEQREYLARWLQQYVDNAAPPAQGYQEGGSVKYPNFIDAQNVATRRAQEMRPRVDEMDTEADAARHMLASGYMAKSFNPTIAKGLGWLHEAKEAPFRTIGHALGLSSPRYDYEMDMHNNALGIELAKKAKDRADFERMVQESLKQSATATTPGRPRVLTQKQAIEGVDALKYANGGTVSQPQSLDAMKYELMMRSK